VALDNSIAWTCGLEIHLRGWVNGFAAVENGKERWLALVVVGFDGIIHSLGSPFNVG
jgi:hypothetical protein